MKKIALILFVLIFIVASGLVIYSPHLIMMKVKKDFAKENYEALTSNINFPILRTKLKQQIKKNILKDIDKKLKTDPFAKIQVLFLTGISDNFVEKFITPEELVKFVRGKSLLNTLFKLKPTNHSNLIQEATYGYESINIFSLCFATTNGETIKIFLERQTPFTWALTNIILPSNFRL